MSNEHLSQPVETDKFVFTPSLHIYFEESDFIIDAAVRSVGRNTITIHVLYESETFFFNADILQVAAVGNSSTVGGEEDCRYVT